MEWLRRIIPSVVLGLALGGWTGAEALTLEGAVDRALTVNVTYQKALLAVDQAAAARSDLVNWKGIAASVTQKEVSETTTADRSSTTTLGLSLPLFDQWETSASVDQDGNAEVGVTLTPLAHSDTRDQAVITYQKAVLAAKQTQTTLDTEVRKAWLAQAAAEAQLKVQVQQTALAETAYRDQRAMYEKNQVTLAEVRSALKDWTDARTTQSTLERTLEKAKADLAGRLQMESVELAVMDTAALQTLIEALGPVNLEIQASSTSIQVQALEVEAQKAKAEAIWWLDPSLTVSGSAVIPAEGDLTWSGSVTLTLALGDWQADDRVLADRALALAQEALTAERTSARSSEVQALLALQAATDTVESRQLALAQAQELLEETQLLSKAGEATPLELEDAALGVAAAENDLFAAWADAYGARLDLLAARS